MGVAAVVVGAIVRLVVTEPTLEVAVPDIELDVHRWDVRRRLAERHVEGFECAPHEAGPDTS